MSTLFGDLKNFGTVWYNPNSLANILYMEEVCKRCRITMDMQKEATISVHRVDESIIKFTEFSSSLYFYNVDNLSKSGVNNYCFTQTVENKNKKKFHHHEIEGVIK